jgi:hypothetical protein
MINAVITSLEKSPNSIADGKGVKLQARNAPRPKNVVKATEQKPKK